MIDGEEAVNVVLLVVFKLLADLGCRQAAHELQDRVHAHRVLGAEWFYFHGGGACLSLGRKVHRPGGR